MNLKVAFSTTDGKILSNTHFGDGDLFPIYEISKTDSKYLLTVENTTEEEEDVHGDPKKAHGITQILKPYNVNILCGRQFGKNIVRIVKKFVPVLVDVKTVDEAINLVIENYVAILEQWQKGENRNHLRLKK
jgi:predicted Fe-Mo cluster-binding NifX family protein